MSKSFCFIPSSSNWLIYHRRVVEESWTAAAASLLRSADRSDRARSSLANKTKKNQHCIFDCHCQGLYNTNGVLYNALAPVVEPPKLHPSPPTNSLLLPPQIRKCVHLSTPSFFLKWIFFRTALSEPIWTNWSTGFATRASWSKLASSSSSSKSGEEQQ